MTAKNLEFDRDIITDFLSGIKSKRVLVIGDIMLDHYIWGKVDRISPEAPVPVVQLEKESYRLGGAGNVANNLASLGINTSIMGITGNDANAKRLKDLFDENKIDHSLVITDEKRPTVSKTRIIAHHQQVVRIDRESGTEIQGVMADKIAGSLGKNISEYDAIIVSDYNKGVITEGNIQRIIGICNDKGRPVAVDPKKHDLMLYDNAYVITPNLKEIESYTGKKIDPYDLTGIEKKGIEILKGSNIKNILVTLGEAGMMLFSKDHECSHSYIKTRAKDVYDVTGAGDTVIAGLMAGIIYGFDVLASSVLANVAAGLVIRRVGTTPVMAEDLLEYFKDGD